MCEYYSEYPKCTYLGMHYHLPDDRPCGNLSHDIKCKCHEGKTTSSSDLINHPPHYTKGEAKCVCGRTIECIDITRHLSFNLGNAVKYIWRCDLKGNSTEDLKKAVFYLNDEIQKRGGGK